MYSELLIGAGNRRLKHLHQPGHAEWSELTTLDFDQDCKPDVYWNLEDLPLPFAADSFDEIHAYEVLEHIGRQGDWRGFFAEFSEYWRILKPGGVLFGSCPNVTSRWAWGDPGHTRIIGAEQLTFLSQAQYTAQVGKTPMTDYRSVYKADFEHVISQLHGELYYFGLRAVK
jgi:SAM-dependent methyltransferase